MIIGLLLIIIGLAFFGKALGFVNDLSMNMIWPLLVIMLGIAILSHKFLGHTCSGRDCWCGGEVHFLGKQKKKK